VARVCQQQPQAEACTKHVWGRRGPRLPTQVYCMATVTDVQLLHMHVNLVIVPLC
jgi:hypothetical protein